MNIVWILISVIAIIVIIYAIREVSKQKPDNTGVPPDDRYPLW